jgi:hypothetical protein
MDTTGLMAPSGSEARRRYDEAEARKRGFYGLMAAVAEPLSYVPGPVGDAAQVAQNIGERGPLEGLMSSWDVVGLPKVLRQGPKVLKMFEKVPVSDSKMEKALKTLSKDVMGPEARELHARTGRLVDVEGNLLGEFSDAGAAPKERLAEVLDAVMARRDPTYTASARASDLFSHPELFRRHPETAEMPVSVRVDTRLKPGTVGGSYERSSQKIFVPPVESAADLTEALRTWLHENQHHIQRKQGLQGGASYDYIKELLADAIKHYSGDQSALLDPGFRRAFERAAMNRYRDTEGELWARNVEARSMLPEGLLRKHYPYDTQTAAGSTSIIPPRSRVLEPYNQPQIDAIARRLLGIPDAPP